MRSFGPTPTRKVGWNSDFPHAGVLPAAFVVAVLSAFTVDATVPVPAPAHAAAVSMVLLLMLLLPELLPLPLLPSFVSVNVTLSVDGDVSVLVRAH